MKELLDSRNKKKEKNKSYKLFNYILYENNKINKNRNIFNNNNIILKEILSKEKPIVIEHFIKEENDNENDYIIYNNNENKSTIDSKNYYKNYQKRFSYSYKNSRINLSSLINEIHHKKNLKKRIDSACQINNKFSFILCNEHENSNFLFFNQKIKENLKKKKNEKFNLVLFPIKKLYKIPKDNINMKKKTRNIILSKNNINKNNNSNNYKSRKLQFKKKRSKPSFFREPNDMDQRTRFNKLKKDLTEEANKINNMFSQFFKNPLFNKFNKIDRIEDLRLKNSLKRPRSVISS